LKLDKPFFLVVHIDLLRVIVARIKFILGGINFRVLAERGNASFLGIASGCFGGLGEPAPKPGRLGIHFYPGLCGRFARRSAKMVLGSQPTEFSLDKFPLL
jgi:hypothetical protein